MYADDHPPQAAIRSSIGRPAAPASLPRVEERYREARARFEAAGLEKMEAALEFLAARAAQGRAMEEVGPGAESRGRESDIRRGSDNVPVFGLEMGIIGQ